VSGALYNLAFRRYTPPDENRPGPREQPSHGRPGVRVAWLGTAGYVVATPSTTLLIDPYVSRFSLGAVAIRSLRPDEGAIERWIPSKVDAVLCGHSHFDHLVDAPRVAQRTGAMIVGSASTCAFARAQGIAESRMACVPRSGFRTRIGDFDVRFVPSLHGRIALGRVPFDGEVESPPRLPARARAYRMGGAFGILLEAAGVRIYHNGSADLIDAELSGEHADVLLVGLAGRQATPGYLRRLAVGLSPRVIVPTHYDAFFAPLEDELHLLPGIDMPGFFADARRFAPGARVLLPDYGQDVHFAASGPPIGLA
jgi:L-ascorbate metabolism protein UlaG (beta-lactamase superfamily)